VSATKTSFCQPQSRSVARIKKRARGRPGRKLSNRMMPLDAFAHSRGSRSAGNATDPHHCGMHPQRNDYPPPPCTLTSAAVRLSAVLQTRDTVASVIITETCICSELGDQSCIDWTIVRNSGVQVIIASIKVCSHLVQQASYKSHPESFREQ
jgi:hypothetical protein